MNSDFINPTCTEDTLRMKVRHEKKLTTVIRRASCNFYQISLFTPGWGLEATRDVDNVCNFSRSLAPTAVLSDFRISSSIWTDPARQRKIFNAQYRRHYSRDLILMHFSRGTCSYLLALNKPTHSERFIWNVRKNECASEVCHESFLKQLLCVSGLHPKLFLTMSHLAS